MKRIIFSLVFSALSLSASAQTYFSDDFETGLGAWTLTDSDGDGNDWYAADVGAPQNGHATSASFSGVALTPDNWMISSAIDLSTATNIHLKWKVYAQDQNWAYENYTVYVATTNSVGALSGSAVSFNEVLTTSVGYMDRSLDLSSFAGQTVYVGFRHHNVTDQHRINIDDVAVTEVLPIDASIIEVNIPEIIVAGNVNIEGTIKNEGTTAISSFDLSWDDGSGPYVQTITQTIASGATFSFTHGTPLLAVVGNFYDIDVCVNLIGDGNAANDCMTSTQLSVVSSIPLKNTLGEAKTGTWCGWCPRGEVGLSAMDTTSTFIGVSIHNGDPMTVPSYDSNIGTYISGGFPNAGVDRVLSVGTGCDFSAMHAQRMNEIAPANISVSAVQIGNIMEVTISAHWVMSATGINYRLGAIITEDWVVGSGSSSWSENNSYNGGGAGPLTDPVSGFDWTTAGSPVDPVDFGGYRYVARALGNNQILGQMGSVPNTINDGGSDSYTYNIPIDSTWELGKCRFIGFLCDPNTGEILNAAYTSIFIGNVGIEPANNESGFSIYPNPSTNITVIGLDLAENIESSVEIKIYNMLGELVFIKGPEQKLSVGDYLQIDVSSFPSGIYNVVAAIDGILYEKKLIVN